MISVFQISHVSAQSVEVLKDGLDNATSLDVTQNAIYVVEQGNNRLLKLAPNGILLLTVGGNGSGNYSFSNPIDVNATNGLKIYVSDYNNRRIQVFDRRGQYLSSISGNQHFNRRRNFTPTQLTVDNLREVIVYDESSNSILRIDDDADLLDEFRLYGEVQQVDDLMIVNQLLYILDKESEQIYVLSENGSYELYYPARGVQAFFTDGETIWKCFKNRIVIEDRSAEPQIIELETEITAVDMQVLDGIIYVLTENSLLKIQE